MLHLAQKVRGANVVATDGTELGVLRDCYFDDRQWMVRYLLVEAGDWLDRRLVPIPTMAVDGPWHRGQITVNVSQDRMRRSPRVDATAFRQTEDETMPTLRALSAYWGVVAEPTAQLSDRLWSVAETAGYHLQASDGEIGHVDDFLVEQANWWIRYLLVDTSNWVGGRAVIVSTDVVRAIDAAEQIMHLAISRDAIKEGPALESIESTISPGEAGPPFAFI